MKLQTQRKRTAAFRWKPSLKLRQMSRRIHCPAAKPRTSAGIPPRWPSRELRTHSRRRASKISQTARITQASWPKHSSSLKRMIQRKLERMGVWRSRTTIRRRCPSASSVRRPASCPAPCPRAHRCASRYTGCLFWRSCSTPWPRIRLRSSCSTGRWRCGRPWTSISASSSATRRERG